MGLACLWFRSSLERYADGALGEGSAGRVRAHVAGCTPCGERVRQLQGLRTLLSAAVSDPADPDWSGFWAGVRAGIGREAPRPIRDPWWLPLWRPLWGHPRLALSGALAASLALTLSLWPVDDDGTLSSAWADPVVVQDVSTQEPEHTVMVYSSADRQLTVIWLFTPDGAPVQEVTSR